MPDLTSAVLIFVILVLTLVIIIFSVQIFSILKDFHKSLKNLDKILVNLGNLSEKIDDTVSGAKLVSLGTKIISSLISHAHHDEPRERT